jgi:site-specific DNA-methyltransferase (adenine-specific)
MLEINKIYNLDCIVGMKEFPDNYFDLAMVDPPYGLPADATHGRGKLKNRIINQDSIHEWDIAPDKEYFDELFRVSKNQIIWGGNYFDLPPTRCIVCWDKVQPWENFSQIELAWTSFDKPAKLFRYDNRSGEKKIHPTQKPVQLYIYLLNQFAEKGNKILDTHVGSGSSLVACKQKGFEFIGFEINERYYKLAKDRIEGIQRKSLF